MKLSFHAVLLTLAQSRSKAPICTFSESAADRIVRRAALIEGCPSHGNCTAPCRLTCPSPYFGFLMPPLTGDKAPRTVTSMACDVRTGKYVAESVPLCLRWAGPSFLYLLLIWYHYSLEHNLFYMLQYHVCPSRFSLGYFLALQPL